MAPIVTKTPVAKVWLPLTYLVRVERPSQTGIGRWSTALSVLLACLVLLPLLGHRALVAWDEGIYAEIAREMLAGPRGLESWLIPHWNGELWFEKPPLQMWLTACSLRLFGLTAFAARLPSALAGVAIVGLLHRWLRLRSGDLPAWLGSIILLSAFGFQHAARAGETDTLLSLFCWIAVLGLANLIGGGRRGWLLFWTGFSLALMTKGAASLTLPCAALLLACMDRRAVCRFAKEFFFGAVLFLAITLPWHLYLYWRFGQDFLREYLGLHVIARASSAIEGHSTQPWFYLWVLLISAFPFALLYLPALAGPLGKPLETKRRLRPLAVFAIVVLCLFSVARTRLPHYIAPVYPALSALTAVWVAERLQRSPRKSLLPLGVAAVAIYAAGAALTSSARRALHSPLLPDGRLTPDNRESAALLEQARRSGMNLPPGPLLILRENAETPVTTDAFYSQRLTQQVRLADDPVSKSADRYSPAPVPLSTVLQPASLMLLDKTLVPKLADAYQMALVATGPTLEVIIASRK